MSRLPQPGSDKGTWGGILNDFLSQSHNADGTIKSTVLPTLTSLGGITPSQVDTKIAAQAATDAGQYAPLSEVTRAQTAEATLKSLMQQTTNKLLLGIAPNGANPTPQVLEAFNSQIAPRRVDMTLLSSSLPNAPLFSYQIAMCQALGVIPQIIWDMPAGTGLGSVTNGSQDTALLNAVFRCQSVPGPVIIRLQHEFNITYVENAASFITGWQYIVNFFNGANANGGNPSHQTAPNVLFFWCPNGWYPGANGNDPSSYYPGDAYTDIVGADFYFYNTMYQKLNFHDLWMPIYNALTALSTKPFMIGEVGVAGGISGWAKSTYFNGMFATLAKNMPRCIGLSYWNQSVSGNDFTIDGTGTDSGALSAFQAGVNSYPFIDSGATIAKPRYADFGSGYDGTVTLDGTSTYAAFATTSGSAPNLVYTLTRDVHAIILTVASGITVKTAGFRMYAQQLFYWQGTLQNNGNNASVYTGGATSLVGTIGVANGGNNGNGGAGYGATQTVGLCGGSGGAGGAGSNGAGGGGRSPLAVPADGFILTSASSGKLIGFPSRSSALLGKVEGAGAVVYLGGGIAGSIGGGDNTNLGGGAGGGGGVVYIAARVVLCSGGTVSATGGNGGTSSGNTGGGGGGGGGSVFVIYETINGSPSLALSGGTGAPGVGTGAAGSNGGTGNYYGIQI